MTTATATRTAISTSSVMATATRLRTGDVVELDIDGQAVSALVLLASGDAVILDGCDDSTPFVVRLCDIGDVRVFRPEHD